MLRFSLKGKLSISNNGGLTLASIWVRVGFYNAGGFLFWVSGGSITSLTFSYVLITGKEFSLEIKWILGADRL